MEYNVKERYENAVANLQNLVADYNRFETEIQRLQNERNLIGNKILASQGVVEELKPFLEEEKVEG